MYVYLYRHIFIEICMYIYHIYLSISREIDCKELAQGIVGAGKSEMCRPGQQAENPGKR